MVLQQHLPSLAEVSPSAIQRTLSECMMTAHLSCEAHTLMYAQVKMPDTQGPVRVRVGMHT
eukprot:scaffold213707_cov19-Tisochrysis_lutea.AAC.1